MRIAVASDGLEVSARSSRCTSYMCYTVERGIVTGCQNTPCPCLPNELAADYLDALDVDVFIVGSIRADAREAFERHGIDLVTGASGPARQAVQRYVALLFSGKGAHDLTPA